MAQCRGSQDHGRRSPPPSIERLNLLVPPIIVTAQNDGHVTAASAFGEKQRDDYRAGWRVIIDEMVVLLREQGYVGGSNEALTWIRPIDGIWKVEMPDGRRFDVFGQRERRMARDRSMVGERDEDTGERIGPPGLIEEFTASGRGRMQPLELLIEGVRGKIATQKFEIHPLASLMPAYTEAEREGLRSDIARNGVKVPVVIFQKKILDGRNRGYFASQLGKPVRITEFTGTEEEARALVISLNLVRRHLSAAQQQLLGLQLFGDESKKEAAEKRTRKPKSVPRNIQGTNNGNSGEEWTDIVTRKAKQAGLTSVSPDGIRAMEHVVNGAPETLAKVESGEIKYPARAAAEAREEKKMPKATTAEGATNSLSIIRRLGKCIGHLSTILVDLEMPAGNMPPEQISERIREIRRLNDEVERALRARRLIS